MASANLEIIQERVRKERYLIKTHALIHALKEGFERKDIVLAVLNGTIVEEYDDHRALICGTAKLSESVDVYLHVVCNTLILSMLSLLRLTFQMNYNGSDLPCGEER